MKGYVTKLKRRRLIFILVPFFVISAGAITAQQKDLPVNAELPLVSPFQYPLENTMSLSGNYGELRGNHFHGGIDFRVGGVTGAPVFASDRGYVSKISVSPSGYGNALYITHLNGFVTVYGHLHKYVDKIQQFVRNKQYENKDFRLSIDLDSTVFPVAKGEKIAYAGNTGSSGGPHLHFEIRNRDNLPLSVFERGYINIEDHTPPVITNVEFYGYSQVYGAPKTFLLEKPRNAETPVKVPMYSYVAIDAIDKMAGTNAKLAVNEYKVYLDTTLIYDLTIGEVPFEQGRYINSLIEYSQKDGNGKSMIKSYVEPGNGLQYRIKAKNDGLIVLPDTLPHKVKIEVLDYKQNKTTKSFTVKRVDSLFVTSMGEKPEGVYMAWPLANIYEKDGFRITIPPASLYRSIYFSLDSAEKRITPYAPVWNVHTGDVPLHAPATVSLKYEGPDSLSGKVLLASVGRGDRLYGAGGVYNEGMVKGKIYAFGTYTVAVDTIPPTIVPNFRNGAILKGDKISFIIRDHLSGIRDYHVEIDGHWVISEFDAKTSRLSIPLPDAKIKRGVTHKLKITVADNKDNKAVATRAFKW